MKSLFSRRNDQHTGQPKTKDSYKFWRSDREQSSTKTAANQPEAYVASRPQAETRTKRSTPKPSQSYPNPQDKPPAPPPTTGPGSSAEQIVYPSTRINTVPLPSSSSQQLPPLPPPRPPTSSRHRESDDVKPQPQLRSFTTPVYGAPPSHMRLEQNKAARYPHSRNDVATIVRHEVWLPPPHAASTARPAEGKEERTRQPVLDEPEGYRSSAEDRGVSRDPNRRERERERTRDRERDRVREREPDRDRIRRPTEREETPRDRDLQRQRDAALERARELEREQVREADRAREKEERDLERSKEREREVEKERQKQREREEARAKEREIEWERQKQREEERAREVERERQKQREREREEARAKEREREIERERQKQREREEERAREVERERQRQREREEERAKERQKEIERERQRELEKEKEREAERERQKDKEREREMERERQRERERELERVKEREREVERERQREREKEMEKDREREQHMEQEREKAKEMEREKERERHREREREKDRERREQRDKARQVERERRDRERELYERERLRRERVVNAEAGTLIKEAATSAPGADPRPPVADLANDRERGKKEDPSGRIQTRQFDQAVPPETGPKPPAPTHDDFRREKATRERHRIRERERDPDQARYRAEATDVEPERYRARAHGDRDRRRESRSGWVSDNYTNLHRKASRQIRQEPPQVDEAGDTSDGSMNRVVGLPKLRRRDRIAEATVPLNSKTFQYGQTPSTQPNLLPAYTTPRVVPFHLPTVETRNSDTTPRNPVSLPEPSRGNEGDGAVRREINRHKLQEDPPPTRNEPLNVIEPPQRPPSRASIMHGSSNTQFLPFSAPFGNTPSSSQAAQRITSNFPGSHNMAENGSKEKLPTHKQSQELRPPPTSNSRQTDLAPGNTFVEPSPGAMQHGLPFGETRDRKPYAHLSQPSSESRYPSHIPMGHSRVPSDGQKEMRGVSEAPASMPAATPLANVVQPSTRHIERVKPSPPFPSNALQTPSLAPRALADESTTRVTTDGFRQAAASAPGHGTYNKLTTQLSAPPQLHLPAIQSKATTVVPDFPLFLTSIPPGRSTAGRDVPGLFSPPNQTQALHKPIVALSGMTGEQKQTLPPFQEPVNSGIASAHKAHHSDSDPLISRNRQDVKAPIQAILWEPTATKNSETVINQPAVSGSSIQRPPTRNQNVRYSVSQAPNGVTSVATSQPTTQVHELSTSQARPNVATSMSALVFPPDATPPNPFLNEPQRRQELLPTWVREPLQEETGPSISRPPTSMASRKDFPDTRAALSVSLGPPAFKSSTDRLPHTLDPAPSSNVFEGRGQLRDLATSEPVDASVERPATNMGGKRDHHARPSHRPTGSGDRPRDITTVVLPEQPTSSQDRYQQEQLGLSSRPPNNGTKQGYQPTQPTRQALEPRTTEFTASQDVGTPAVRPPTTNGLKRVPLANALPTGLSEMQPWLQGPSVQPHIVARPPTASGLRKEHAPTALRRSEASSNIITAVAGHVREPGGGFSTALPIQTLSQMEESLTQRHNRANNVPVPTSSTDQNPASVDNRGATPWRRPVVQEDTTPPNAAKILPLSHNSQAAYHAGLEYQPTVEKRFEERVQYPVPSSAPHESPKFKQRTENTPLLHNPVSLMADDQRKISKEDSPQHRTEVRDQVTRSSPVVQSTSEIREEPRLRKQDSPRIVGNDQTSVANAKPPELQRIDPVPQIKIHRPATAMGQSTVPHALLDSNISEKPRNDVLLTIGPSPQSSRQSSTNPSSSQADNLITTQAPPRHSPLFKGQIPDAGEPQPYPSSLARSEAISSKKISGNSAIHHTPTVEPIPPVLQANYGRYARSSPQTNNAHFVAHPASGHVNDRESHDHQRIQDTPRSRESPPGRRVEGEVDDIKPNATSSVVHQTRTEAELLRSAVPALLPLPAHQSEIERTQTPLFQKIHHPKLAELLSSPPSSQPFTLKPGTTQSTENTRNIFTAPSAASNGYPPTIVSDAARSSPPEKVKDTLRFEPRQRETAVTRTIPTSYTQPTRGQTRSVMVHETPAQPTNSAIKTRANLMPEPTNNPMMLGAAASKPQPSTSNKLSEGYPSARSTSQPLDVRFGTSSQTHDNAPPASVATRSHPRHHQHSSSLPMNLPPPSGAGFEPARSSTPAVVQSQPPLLLSLQTNSDEPNDKRKPTLPTAPSEETILMTPSSLGQNSALKPTTSRQSTTPSVKSQTAKKGFLDRFRRSSTPAPAVQPQQFQVWHPNASASTPEGSPGHRKRAESPEVETKITLPSPPPRVPISIDIPVRDRVQEPISPAAQVFNPFNYLTKRRNYGVDNASMEARDGATSTIIGSPTASLLSAVAVQLPPNRDTRQATSEWLSNEEVHIRTRPQRRRHRPGVVIEAAEDPPENKQRPKRNATRYKRPKGSSKPPPNLPTNS